MEWPKWLKREKTGDVVQDKQTRESFETETEALWDVAAATFSVLYLIAMLVFFCWQLLDMFIGRNLVLELVSPHRDDYLKWPLFQLIAYTVIGGGSGRSC